MLIPVRILFFFLAGIPILMALLFFICTEEQPAVRLDWSLTQRDIARAKHILKEASKTTGASLQTLDLTEKDLNIAANYLLNRHIVSDTSINLYNDSLNILITLPMHTNSFSRFLNIQFDLIILDDKPAIENLYIGPLAIANEFSGQLILKIIQHSQLKRYDILVRQHIKHIRITPDRMAISYHPGPKTLAKTQNLLSNDINSSALTLYYKKLDQVIRNHDRNWLLSLADILQPLFLLAYQRSTLDNAIDENRAVLYVVNSYVNQTSLQRFLPLAKHQPNIQYLEVYVYKRTDLSKHFIGSAALTASGSSYIADQIGIKKELTDSIKGSGFSFIDLTADRAGTYFGDKATSSPENARAIQKAMANITDYTAFIPNALDLPENLDEETFRKRFGSVESRSYQTMLDIIDKRIAELPVYSSL